MAGGNREGGRVRPRPGNAERIQHRVAGRVAAIDRDVAGDRGRPLVLRDGRHPADRCRRRHRGRGLGIRHAADDDPTGAGTLPPEQTYYGLSLFRLR